MSSQIYFEHILWETPLDVLLNRCTTVWESSAFLHTTTGGLRGLRGTELSLAPAPIYPGKFDPTVWCCVFVLPCLPNILCYWLNKELNCQWLGRWGYAGLLDRDGNSGKESQRQGIQQLDAREAGCKVLRRNNEPYGRT